jgi:hypothetical protein
MPFYDSAFSSLLHADARKPVALRDFHFVYGMWMLDTSLRFKHVNLPWDHVKIHGRLRDRGIYFKLAQVKLESQPRH